MMEREDDGGGVMGCGKNTSGDACLRPPKDVAVSLLSYFFLLADFFVAAFLVAGFLAAAFLVAMVSILPLPQR
jgi:hypothetical protein